MNGRSITRILVAMAASLLFIGVAMADDTPQFSVAPINPAVFDYPPNATGWVPPSVDMSHLKPLPGAKTTTSSYDTRPLGYQTPIEDQGAYDLCWTFSATGDLESKVASEENIIENLSESHIFGCNLWGATCDSGGNAYTSTAVLTTSPSQFESCNAYPPINCASPVCNTSCAGQEYVTGWRILPDSNTSIKTALMDYGPVQTTVYSSFPDFSAPPPDQYDGTCILNYSGTDDPNHAVLIVGWDDDMTLPLCNPSGEKISGTGAWIVKNSWGDSWGDNGYFYIAYDNARIGENSSVYTGYKPYDDYEDLYFYDEQGFVGNLGCGTATAYGLVKFTPNRGGMLTHVDFWVTDSLVNYEIKIYDSFNGTAPVTQLGTTETGSAQAGYVSVPLTTPVAVTGGTPFVIVAKLTTTTADYYYPLPAEYDTGGVLPTPTIETNKCYMSCDGASWFHIGAGSSYEWDLGIRGRVEVSDAIGLSKTAINFKATAGGANPADKTFSISNVGPGTINYTVADNADWLTVNPTTGSSDGEADDITVSVDITGLAVGVHNATITITSGEASNSPQTVNVTLNVKKDGGGGDDGGGGGSSGSCNQVARGPVSSVELAQAGLGLMVFGFVFLVLRRRRNG